jgi:alanyl aminopeptidase
MQLFGSGVATLGILSSTLFASAADGEIDRLPKNPRPVFQRIELTLDARERDYTGSTTVELQVIAPTKTLRFHAEGLTIESLAVTQRGKPQTATFAAIDTQTVEVSLGQPLTTGQAKLAITFRNAFDTTAVSLYRLDFEGHAYSYTQFEDVHAREAFPCWDEPSFKFPYQFVLTVPERDVALTNTPALSEQLKGGVKTVTFARTKPLPSYLLAIATGPFEFVPIPGTSIPARVVTPKGKSGLVREAVAATPPLLNVLEQYFDQPYPYEKLDLIAVPEFWYGAMENPGLITFRDETLLLDPVTTDPGDIERLQRIVAHELAHIWFGDLVTMAWWDDLWLNESFAEWMATKAVNRVYPASKYEARQIDGVQSAYRIDALPTTRAIRQPVKSQAVLLQAADALAYKKGEAALEMVESWIGDDKFRQGVLAYLKRFAWKNAQGSDLWTALGKAAGAEVASVLTSYLDQPGMPLLQAEILAGGKVRLSQSRYTLAGSPAPAQQLWKIPLTLTFQAQGRVAKRLLVLDRPSLELVLTDGAEIEWLHPNASEKAYARWSLPPQQLQRLAQARNQLDLRERMNFSRNAVALLSCGAIEADSLLELLESTLRDDDPLVFEQALESIDAIWEPFSDGPGREPMRRWVARALAPAAANLGTTPRPGEDLRWSLLRPLVLRWRDEATDDRELVLWASRAASQLLESGSGVDPTLISTVMRIAARHGDVSLFERIRMRYESSSSASLKPILLNALGNFGDRQLANKALDYALEGPIPPDELMEIPSEVAENRDHKGVAYDWVKQHFEPIKARVPQFALSYLPWFAAGCDLERVADARSFFLDPARAVPGTERTMNQVGAAVAACSSLRERAQPSLLRYLGAGSQPASTSTH